MSVTIYTNPTRRQIAAFHKKNPHLTQSVIEKIASANIRIEFDQSDTYIFGVFYIPEYVRAARTIQSIEVNICYDRRTHDATIFAFDTQHFFAKYTSMIEAIPTRSFSVFIEQLLDIILDDESRIIEHILKDTQEVRREYSSDEDSTTVLRHLTNTLMNISTLKLVVKNQDDLIDKVEASIRHYEDSPVSYKRAYINEELDYARDFCETLMHSINTKYQVRQSDLLYAYTRYTFVIFLAGVVLQAVYALVSDESPYKVTFVIASGLTLMGSIVMFSRFK